MQRTEATKQKAEKERAKSIESGNEGKIWFVKECEMVHGIRLYCEL